MKFSFVIPIYRKRPETLRNCLKSLFNMSHKDIEVLCVFDGPDADLESVAKEFPVNHSIVIEHGGACKARNAGAKLMSPDGFVSFWDADCFAEPEMASMWEMTLKDNLDCDFCYSGYAWSDAKLKGYESEPFDPYVLEHYNYIASMFPLAKDKFPGWDESLTGLQDWDYWRRVVRAGSKGAFIPGFGFTTDLPDKDSISGGEDPDELKAKTAARIATVRKKLGDPDSDIVVHGLAYKPQAAFVSKVLKSDFIWNPFWLVKPYKLSVMVGFATENLNIIKNTIKASDKDTKRAVYWMGLDAESFYNAPYWQAKIVLKDFEEAIHFHFCNEQRTKDILSDMGIQAEILPFPYDAEKEGITLPEKFKVIVLADEAHSRVIEGIVKALPDIEFTKVMPDVYYNMMDYTASLQYMVNKRLDNNSRNFLIKGRYLISNVDEPFAGYLPLGEDPVKFKNDIINKLRELKTVNKPNMEAREYYLGNASPEKFKDKIYSLLAPRLEVVS
jgi:glycosyltransferase involved in cell wall biosynthesis